MNSDFPFFVLEQDAIALAALISCLIFFCMGAQHQCRSYDCIDYDFFLRLYFWHVFLYWRVGREGHNKQQRSLAGNELGMLQLCGMCRELDGI